MRSRKEIWILGVHNYKELPSRNTVNMNINLTRAEFRFLSNHAHKVTAHVIRACYFKDRSQLKEYVKQKIDAFVTQKEGVLLLFFDSWLRDECTHIGSVIDCHKQVRKLIVDKTRKREKAYHLKWVRCY